MDPADSGQVQHALSNQGALLDQHSQELRELGEGMRRMFGMLSQISSTLQIPPPLPSAPAPPPIPAAPVPPTCHREPLQPAPERYEGDPERCRSFLLQCALVFRQQPRLFHDDDRRISYVIGLLKGKALDWATAVWEDQASLSTYHEFTAELKKVFEHPVGGEDPSDKLLSVRQRDRSVADYSIEFRTLAANTGWNNSALIGVFQAGLGGAVKDELAVRDRPPNLDALIDLSIRIDNRIRQRNQEKKPAPPVAHAYSRPSRPPAPTVREEVKVPGEAMDIGRVRSKVTSEERAKRRAAGACFYCGQVGHSVKTCSLRPKE